jgi:hypothetical protein
VSAGRKYEAWEIAKQEMLALSAFTAKHPVVTVEDIDKMARYIADQSMSLSLQSLEKAWKATR